MRSLRHFLKIFFFGFVILKLCDGRISRSIKSLKYERNGKFLFNIIQFKNDICEITAGPVNEELGVCYTSDECTSRGGMQRKSCAAGFGTCCHFRSSCFGDVSSPLAYFTNPSYPTTDNMPNYCSYNIKVTNPDVCQVRLDFLDFNLSGPDLSTAPYGRCSQDRMAVFATQQNLGLSEGNLLCGDMTGQHIYVPVNATMGQDSVRLFAMVGTAFALNGGITNTSTVPGVVLNYKWNIKIRQIDCKSNDPIVAPIGCLQYFTTPVGSIESFNFRMAGSIYPISLDYAICVKKQPGFGCINLGTVTAGDEMKMNTNGAASSDGVGPYCYHFTSLWTATASYVSNDFIGIADGVTVNGTVKVMTSHVCGIYDPLVANFPTVSSSFAGPIVLQVKTDESLKGIAMIGPPINPQQALTFVQEGYENGFRLTYSFTNTCPTITV